jgi:hypothetical protein
MRTLAMTIRGREVTLDHVVALRVRAGGDVAISRGGCGPVTAGGDVTIRQGGCGPVRASRVTIGSDGVAGLVVADEVTVEPGGIVQRQVPADAVRWAGTGAIVGLLVGGLLARRR